MVKVTPKNEVKQKLHGEEVNPNLIDAVNSWQSHNIANTVMTQEHVPNSPSRVMDLLANETKKAEVSNVNTTIEIKTNNYLPVTTITTIPSQFKPYKLMYTPKPEISYSPYKFGEIKKLNSSKMSPKQVFLEVLSGITCNFDKMKLTFSDFTYLGLMRRVATLTTARFNAQFECKVCGHINKMDFDHTKLAEVNLNRELPVSIELASKLYVFTPLTIEDYIFLYDENLLEDVVAYYAVQCRNNDIDITVEKRNGYTLNDTQKRFYSIYDVFYNLTSSDEVEDLESLDTYLDHKIKPVTMNCVGKINYKDENDEEKTEICKNPISVALDGGGVLITPFRESDEPVRHKIRFGT